MPGGGDIAGKNFKGVYWLKKTIMIKSFFINLDLIRTNALSPNHNYFYKINVPSSLNPSAFGCKAAFFSLPHESLIYYNSNVVLHELHLKEKIDQKYQQMLKKKTFDMKPKENLLDFVWWSLQGNMSYFLEYKIGRNYEPIYNSIFLHLYEGYYYSIDESKNNFDIINSLKLKDREFDQEVITKKLQDLGLKRHPVLKDKFFKRDFIDKLFNKNKWYPI